MAAAVMLSAAAAATRLRTREGPAREGG